MAKVYQKFKLPLMSERELVMEFKMIDLTGDLAGKKLWLMKSCEDPKYPVNKNCIRVSISKATLIWEEDGSIVGDEFATFNLGGYFPMRLLNMSTGAATKKGVEDNYKKMLAMQNGEMSTGSNTA